MSINLVMKFTIVLPFFFTLCAGSVLFPTPASKARFLRRAEKSREMLLDNLKGHFLINEPRVVVEEIVTGMDSNEVFEREANYFLSLPIELLCLIFDHLDPESLLDNFKILCKQANRLAKQVIKHILKRFGNCFAFDEDWFNEDIYRIISKNFPSNISIKSSEVYDYLELMTLKWILREEECSANSNLPRHIYFCVISFFHEIFYGLESYLPTTENEWIASFGIKIQKYEFPRTKKYFFNMKLCDSVRMALEFLSQKPSIQEQREFYDRNIEVLRFFEKDFLVFQQNWVSGPLSDAEAEKFLGSSFRVIGYPEAIIKNIKASKEMFVARSPSIRFFPHNPYIRGLFRNSNFEIENSYNYIFSRDLQHPFIFDEILQFPDFKAQWLFYDMMMRLKMPLIIKIDIMAKLIKSGLLKLHSHDVISRLLFETAPFRRLPFFELLMLESPVFINFASDYRFYFNTIERRHFYMKSSRRALIFKTQIARDNPLALIFYIGPHAEEFKALIASKFNLNVKYRFDCEIPPFPDAWADETFNNRFQGREVTFKRIIAEMDNESYRNIFGLDTLEPEPEDDTEYPLFSLQAYFNDPNNARVPVQLSDLLCKCIRQVFSGFSDCFMSFY